MYHKLYKIAMLLQSAMCLYHILCYACIMIYILLYIISYYIILCVHFVGYLPYHILSQALSRSFYHIFCRISILIFASAAGLLMARDYPHHTMGPLRARDYPWRGSTHIMGLLMSQSYPQYEISHGAGLPTLWCYSWRGTTPNIGLVTALRDHPCYGALTWQQKHKRML